jgi:hypothetical protein
MLDEAEALPALLAELHGLGLLGRTIFVDNGSSDGGPEIVRAAGPCAAPRPGGCPFTSGAATTGWP